MLDTSQRMSRPGLIRLADEVARNPGKLTPAVRRNLGPLVRSLSRRGGVFDNAYNHNEVQAERTSDNEWIYRNVSGRKLPLTEVYDWLKSMVLLTYTASLACWKGGYGNAIRYERKCAIDRTRIDPHVFDVLLAQ